uniref:Heme-binding protein 1 n=1 Tax=Salarias fasciatus TaxID=181472 RepID=A0A672FNR0_SALFA
MLNRSQKNQKDQNATTMVFLHCRPSTNNSFCTESKECLEYELVCKTDEYEVRHYSPTRWVSTDAEAYFMGVGAAMAFRRLFQYITGANEGGFQMEMTAPVLVKIPEETKMWEPAVYTLNFPLPAAYQDKPPAPTNDKLYFTEMPEMDVYVRSYGGWMLSVTSRLHAHLLTKELERVRASYNRSYHYGVGYDSPLKLLNRHNEVWYVAEGEPVCSDPREPTPAHTPRPTTTDLPTDAPTDASSHVPSDSPSNLQSDTANAPSALKANAPSALQADTPSPPQADAPSPPQADAPSDLQDDAPSDPQADAPSDPQADAPSENLAADSGNLYITDQYHAGSNCIRLIYVRKRNYLNCRRCTE